MLRQCEKKGCSHILFSSQKEYHEVTIPIIETNQNRRHFYTTSMEIDDIMMFSDIPALDGSWSAKDEAKYTYNSIDKVNKGVVPTKWQRPTKKKRIQGKDGSGISSWLSKNSKNSIPDGILIGFSDKYPKSLKINTKSFQKIDGSRVVRIVTISQTLKSSCELHKKDLDTDAYKYQNRCFDHGCEKHDDTTSPLVIIDGQHRVLGLYKAEIDHKQVSVSLLPPISQVKKTKSSKKELTGPGNVENQQQNSTNKKELTGYSPRDLAVVFEQVNSKGERLHESHLLWLRRMFGDWSDPPPTRSPQNDRRQAYDLLAELGSFPRQAPVPDPWISRVKMLKGHKDDEITGSYYVDNPPFIVGKGSKGKRPSGMINQTAAFESIITELNKICKNTGKDHGEVLGYWLDCWKSIAEDRFKVGGLFAESTRAFAALIRTIPITLEKMAAEGYVDLDHEDFFKVLDTFSSHFDSQNWDEFVRSTGEPVQRFLYNCLSQMLKKGGTGPKWKTQSPNDNVRWEDWILLAPDPLISFSPVTHLVGGNQRDDITRNLTTENSRQTANTEVNSLLEWKSPWNIGKHVSGSWRKHDSSESRLKGFGKKVFGKKDVCASDRTCSFDLNDAGNLTQWLENNNGNGTKWDLSLGYETPKAQIKIIIGFVS